MIIKESGLTHIKNGYGTVHNTSYIKGQRVYLEVGQCDTTTIGLHAPNKTYPPEVVISFDNLNSIDV